MPPAPPPGTPRKRRSTKGEARRRHILEVARAIFSEGGYHSASIADIAARAGISQTGLLHHFPSKPDLLLAVLNARDAETIQPPPEDDPTGMPFVNGYLRGLRQHDSDPELVQLNAMLSAEALANGHPAHDYFVNQYQRRLDDFAQRVSGAFDFDAMPEGVTARTLARWSIALAEGMRQQMLYEDDPVDRAEILALFFRTLSRYQLDDTPVDSVESGTG